MVIGCIILVAAILVAFVETRPSREMDAEFDVRLFRLLRKQAGVEIQNPQFDIRPAGEAPKIESINMKRIA